ncbi:putative PTP1-interacting protein, 39 kDa [Trypanosoma theileri]|uniref:Mitochondrial import inner membrane translocase subunit TIM50 n=1 Tax=Trypanosoma theileri TaxID=67003 RepID=A0A1X0NUJ8_9TRYP|nr:putative PTP1-interacting protein, 39 kDa [Trypanosoma theileri]ORC88163.1 putative PTP1-interacting protein, 39 kDa [Trypanosoma theileri]
MVRASRYSYMRAKPVMQKLQSIVAFGLRQEYPPVWPLPLPPPLPQSVGKPTLVLDIDETLLHTYGMHLVQSNLNIEEGTNNNNNNNMNNTAADTIAFSLFLRPLLREFLMEVKELYEIVFWTAGTASYCSAMVDAMEVQVLQLPPSFYNVQEMLRDAKSTETREGNDHVNFFALSRTQTLEEHSYMKYLPMLGRPMHRVIMIDDNVRSFPLHPRNGVRIAPFLPDDKVLHDYSYAAIQLQEDETLMNNEDLLKKIKSGKQEIARLERDQALLDLLPLLRAAAAAEDLPRELDYWRDDDYIRCDDFRETMNPRSVTRQRLLGSVLPHRRETPIPPPKTHVMNHGFLEEANTAMRVQQMRKARARL